MRRPVALVSLFVVLIVGTAVGVTIWRYEGAMQSRAQALVSAADEAHTRAAAVAVWHEREAMNENLLTSKVRNGAEITGADRELRAVLERMAVLGADTGREGELEDEIGPANRRFLRVFASVRAQRRAGMIRRPRR